MVFVRGMVLAGFLLAVGTGQAAAAPAVSEQEFFASDFIDGDLTAFLQKKSIKIDCTFRKDQAIKSRFTGLVTTCVTKTEWKRPAPGKPYGHHPVTRVVWLTQYKDGILHGAELFAGSESRTYKEFDEGRLVKHAYTMPGGRIERKIYPDCLASMTQAKLIAVPQEYRFIQTFGPLLCGGGDGIRREVAENCKDSDQGRPVSGKVRLYGDHGGLLAVQTFADGYLNGLTMEYKQDNIQFAVFSKGKETHYAAFERDSCRFNPRSDPRKRTTSYDSKAFNPYFMHVRAHRPDTNEEYKRQMKWRTGYSLLYMPVVYLGAPLLVWVAPGLYNGSYPTASATYSFMDRYWEGGIGILNFRTKDIAATGHAFHYTYKKVEGRGLWGMRFSAGVSAFYFMAALQGGLHFEKNRLSQLGLDVCVGPFLSACAGTRIPLREEVRDLEAPLQISLKLGL